jgi:hypothetical protein
MFRQIFEEVFEELTEMANLGNAKHNLGSSITVNVHQGDKNTHGPRIKVFRKGQSSDYVTITINRNSKEIGYKGITPKWFKGSLKKSTEVFTVNNAQNLIDLYDDKDLSPDDLDWV